MVEIRRQLANQLFERDEEIFVAPFDVKLSASDLDHRPTIVQPDVIVCSNPSAFDRRVFE